MTAPEMGSATRAVLARMNVQIAHGIAEQLDDLAAALPDDALFGQPTAHKLILMAQSLRCIADMMEEATR